MSEEKQESVWRHPMVLICVGSLLTVVLGLVAWRIQQAWTQKPDMTALCSVNTLKDKAYTEKYVNTLLTTIEKLQTAVERPAYERQWGSDKTDAEVGGEVRCAVKNTGSSVASKLKLTLPPTVIGMMTNGVAVPFNPKQPEYEQASLNSGESFTVVAQYNSLIPEMLYVNMPTVTFAEGLPVTAELERPYHGFAATVASNVTAIGLAFVWMLSMALCYFLLTGLTQVYIRWTNKRNAIK